MTNQERALGIMGKLNEAEKAAAKLPASPQKTALIAAQTALHAELQTHATAMAVGLDLDLGQLSLGGSK